jgi:hypothetical protein
MNSDVFRKLTGVMFAAAAFAATPASALTFHNYDSVNFGNELLTTIPGDQVHRVFYSIDVSTLSAQDVLVVFSEFMTTNETTATKRLSAQLILANSATAISGTELDEANDRNVTPNGGIPPGHGGMHHCIRVKGAITQFASAPDPSLHYVNLIVWATGDFSVPTPTSTGRLQALKITP